MFYIILALFIIIYYFKKYTLFKYWQKKNLPCEKAYPFLGNIPDILSSSVPHYFATLYKKYEGHTCFGVYFLETPCLVLRCPELIKSVLVQNFSKFPNRAFTIDKQADPLACNSVFAVKNPEWKALRSKLSPIFTAGKMKLMVPLMNATCKKLVRYLGIEDGRTINVKELLGKYSMEAVASCTFGIEINCFEDEESDLKIYGKKIFVTNIWRKLCIFGYFLAPALVRMFKFSFFDWDTTFYLHKLFSGILENRERSGMKRNDLVDILIELKKQQSDDIKFDDITISSQAITFFSAGHETTSTTVALASYELALHPHVQEKLRNEINDTFQDQKEITYETLVNMQYLHSVMCETLRKYTQGPFLIRECIEDCYLDPYCIKVEAGSQVLIPITAIHTDPRFYEDPFEFIPQRFMEEKKSSLIPYTYLAFGGGPRNCIGERFAMLSAKVAMIHLLRNFEVVPSEVTPKRLELNDQSLLLEVLGGIPLIFNKLKSN